MAVVSLVAHVSAKTAEFEKSFSKASSTAAQFEKQYGALASSVSAHQQRIEKAFQSFSGDKIIREANEYASAIAKVGGAAKLTEAEQRRVNATVTEAIAKYQALGQVAPKALTDLAKATSQVPASIGTATKATSLFGESLDRVGQKSGIAGTAMGVLGSTIGKFTLAGVAVSAINNLAGAFVGFASKGSALGPLEKSFENLSKSVRQNSGEMLSSMQDATRGLVSNFDLMQSANKAVLLGLPVTSREMGDLSKTARILGKAMGLDATQSLNDLVTALGRSSPLILDNLGLTVKVGEANDRYAAALGKTADSLSDAEKKTAFYNAAMEAARRKTEELGDQTPTVTELAAGAWTTFGNSVSSTVSFINQELGRLISDTASAASDIGTTLANAARNGPRATFMSFFSDQMASRMSSGNSGPATLPAPALPPDYVAKIAEATARVSELTKAQRDQIKAAETLGGSALKELMDRYRLTDVHLKVLSESTKDAAASTRKMEKAATEAAAAERKRVDVLTSIQELQSRTIANLAAGSEDLAQVWRSLPGRDVDLPILPALARANEAVEEFRRETVSNLKAGAQDLSFVFKSLPGTLVPVRDMFTEASEEAKKLRQKFDHITNTIGNFGAAFGGLTGQIVSGSGQILQSFITMGTAAKGLATTLAAIDFGVILGEKLKPLLNLWEGKLGALVGTNSTGRSAVNDFAQLQGGYDALHARLLTLGAEGERMWVTLTQGVGRANPTQAAAAIDQVTNALARTPSAQADGAGYRTIEQLTQTALEARRVYEYMVETGKYSASEIARAFEASGKAQEASFGAAGSAQLEAVNKLKGRIGELGSAFESLNNSIRDEAPEEVMGIVEAQTRARMEAIKSEQTALQTQLDESLTASGIAAQKTASEIEDALSKIRVPPIVIQYTYEATNQPTFPNGGTFPVPALASGGIVTRPTLALVGERGPEAVIPLSQLGRSQGGGGTMTNVIMLDGEVIAKQLVKTGKRQGYY